MANFSSTVPPSARSSAMLVTTVNMEAVISALKIPTAQKVKSEEIFNISQERHEGLSHYFSKKRYKLTYNFQRVSTN